MNRIYTLALLLFCIMASAQVTNSGKPESWKIPDIETINPIVMPGFDLAALQQEDKLNEDNFNIPWRFGYEFLVDNTLQNSGKWDDLPNGGRIWRIRYRSEGAKTMNFLFTDFYMPEGATLYLYNNEHTDLLGAYDSKQNNEQRVLGTWIVKGEDIWLEYYEPANVAGQGKLEIFKVVHGYRTANAMVNRNDYDNCYRDVDCPMPDIQALKDINKKAVGLVLVNNSAWCTGALVTNTSNDGTPYFLTANHCYSDPAQWAFRFNWISPDPVCASTGDSPSNSPEEYHTVSGAVLRAKYFNSDFCLMEIAQPLPVSWNMVLAGWDKSDVPPPSTFAIHHPLGAIMKANRDLDPPLLSLGINWTVQNWELGANAQGSSGSPLFDDQGRIIGQLYGGNSGCSGTTGNNLHDFYGRFGVSWEGGGTPDSRLRDWLDPGNTNAIVQDYYQHPVLAVDAAITIDNVESSNCNELHPSVKLRNMGTETLVSAQIEYSVNSGAPGVFNWTGSLATDDVTVIQLPQMTGITGTNVVSAALTMANGAVDTYTVNNTDTTNFTVMLYPVGNVHLELATDYSAFENHWELRYENGALLYQGGSLENASIYGQTFSLTMDGCYTFTIFDSGGNGICCDGGDGSYELTDANGAIIAQGGSFGASESVSFRLGDVLFVENNPLAEIKVYPNPFRDTFTISGNKGTLSYSIYNVLGQVTDTGVLLGKENTIDLSSSADGIYMLKATDAQTGKASFFKLVKE